MVNVHEKYAEGKNSVGDCVNTENQVAKNDGVGCGAINVCGNGGAYCNSENCILAKKFYANKEYGKNNNRKEHIKK